MLSINYQFTDFSSLLGLETTFLSTVPKPLPNLRVPSAIVDHWYWLCGSGIMLMLALVVVLLMVLAKLALILMSMTLALLKLQMMVIEISTLYH